MISAKNTKAFWCRIGLHAWENSRPLTVFDAFPAFYMPYENPTRTCTRPNCDASQHWLPGYGGSEIGCWVSDRK